MLYARTSLRSSRCRLHVSACSLRLSWSLQESDIHTSTYVAHGHVCVLWTLLPMLASTSTSVGGEAYHESELRHVRGGMRRGRQLQILVQHSLLTPSTSLLTSARRTNSYRSCEPYAKSAANHCRPFSSSPNQTRRSNSELRLNFTQLFLKLRFASLFWR